MLDKLPTEKIFKLYDEACNDPTIYEGFAQFYKTFQEAMAQNSGLKQAASELIEAIENNVVPSLGILERTAAPAIIYYIRKVLGL